MVTSRFTAPDKQKAASLEAAFLLLTLSEIQWGSVKLNL